MTALDAGAGAHLDLGPVSLQAILDLQASVDSLTKIFKAWRDEEKAYEYGALDVPVAGSGVYATGADLVFNCGGPPIGKMWEIRRLAVGAPNPETAVAGVAYFYVAAHHPSKTAPTLLNFFDWTGYTGTATYNTELPSVAFYSTRQLQLHYPENLYAVINGGTNLQQYAVAGRAVETPDRLYRERVEL